MYTGHLPVWAFKAELLKPTMSEWIQLCVLGYGVTNSKWAECNKIEYDTSCMVGAAIMAVLPLRLVIKKGWLLGIVEVG